MDRYYDAVVIGAGPAGSACGIVLQKNQYNVCVIDKALFPRNKTCAGLVTGKTFKLISSLFDGEKTDELFCCRASSIKLYQKNLLLAEGVMKNGAKLVNRIDFDNALVDRYKSLGGELKEGERRFDIDYTENLITLSTGDILHYKYLVFADGALSMSHQLINVNKRKMAFGIETYVPADQFSTDTVDIYFDCIENGYLWAFPHGDTVCIGATNMYNKKTDYKKVVAGFLESNGVDPKKQQYTGAFLPYGYVVPQNKLPNNVLLIGDAGGFADPISGEGLYMAMETGMLAAKALLSDEPKDAYLSSLKPFISIVKHGKKAQKVFFSTSIMNRFVKKVKGKDALVAFFYDNMVDEYRYDYRRMDRLYGDYKQQKVLL